MRVVPNLQALRLLRILQALGGGGMVPVAQSILADSFPPAKRGQVFAVSGVAVVAAPAVGPTLGGWLSDNFSRQWCFLINARIGALAMGLIALVLRESATERAQRGLPQQGKGFDVVGSSWWRRSLARCRSFSIEDDGFDSPFIATFAVIAVPLSCS